MSRLDDLLALQRELVKEIARETATQARVRRLRIRAAATMTRGAWNTRVFYAACEHFGVTADHTLGGTRERAAVDARHVAMWLMRDAGRSYPEIGKEIGMDHTTVINGVRRVAASRLLLETAMEIRAALTGEHTDGKPRRTDQPIETKQRWSKMLAHRPDLADLPNRPKKSGDQDPDLFGGVA